MQDGTTKKRDKNWENEAIVAHAAVIASYHEAREALRTLTGNKFDEQFHTEYPELREYASAIVDLIHFLELRSNYAILLESKQSLTDGQIGAYNLALTKASQALSQLNLASLELS